MRSFLSVAFLVCLLQHLQAQNGAKLTVPTSPAFSILNFEPAAVMRPTNARELAADVLNSFDKEGNLLLNLGLETTPYWLMSHPNLKRATYLNPNPGQAFLQSFTLSAATVKDSVTGNNKLGTGFRFKLFNGKPLVKELAPVTAELDASTTILGIINAGRRLAGSAITTRQGAIDFIVDALNQNRTAQEVIETVRSQAETLHGTYTDSTADIRAFLQELISIRSEADRELIKKKSDLLYERTGFILEFAGAAGYHTSETKSLERTGLWGNASYFVSPDDLLTLTARFMNQRTDTSLTNVDMGLGFLKKTARYNISVEGMFRWFRAEIPDFNSSNQPIVRLEKDFTYRLAVQSSYMINRDISININLGKDFDSPFISGSGFFSMLGFNYSLFSRKPAELKE